MKHPSEARLALYAGDDLGTVARWRVDRHLGRCPECRDRVQEFESALEIIPDLAETPEIAWNRLAGEMKANIRLGLAAGECVRAEQPAPGARLFSGMRAAVALASVAALMVTGLMLERPAPGPAVARQQEGIVVQTTAEGIQVSGGGRAFGLMHGKLKLERTDVTYTVGAQGSMRARYVDPETGNVTVNNVYAE